MAGQYIISDYENEGDETPRIRFGTGDRATAIRSFTRSAQRRVRSVVLCYYSNTDTVLRMAIHGAPMYLVKAIERTRRYLEQNGLVRIATRIFSEALAGYVIGAITGALTGVPVPGVGGVIVSQFCHPSLKRKRDGSTRPRGVLIGGASGGALGFLAGGPFGAFLCGVTGAVAGALGAPSVVESFSQPLRKCTECRGAGMVADFRRCQTCTGKGYLQ